MAEVSERRILVWSLISKQWKGLLKNRDGIGKISFECFFNTLPISSAAIRDIEDGRNFRREAIFLERKRGRRNYNDTFSIYHRLPSIEGTKIASG